LAHRHLDDSTPLRLVETKWSGFTGASH